MLDTSAHTYPTILLTLNLEGQILSVHFPDEYQGLDSVRDELLKLSFEEASRLMIAPESLDVVVKAFDTVRTKGGSVGHIITAQYGQKRFQIDLLLAKSHVPNQLLLIARNITEEMLLQQKNQRYGQLFESLQVGMIVLNVKGENDFQISTYNQAAQNLLGGGERQWHDQSLFDVLPAIRYVSLPKLIFQAYQSQQTLENVEIYFPDHTKKNQYWSFKIVSLESECIGLVFENITGYKRQMKEYQHHSMILENMSDAVVATNSDLRVNSWNHAAERLFKWRADEAIGKNLTELIQFPSREAFTEVMKIIVEKKSWKGELKIDVKEAKKLHIMASIRSIEDAKGIPQTFIGIFRDLTYERQREERLRQSESRYRSLVEHMNEGLVLSDLDEKILFVNDRMCEILGMPREEILGKKSYEIVGYDKNFQNLLFQKKELRKQGKADMYEVCLEISESRDKVWLLIAGAPFRDQHDEIVGSFAVMTDITERKKTELKLKEKNAELDAFVYKASHDLKGPLASIIGLTNVAQTETQDPQAQRYFDLISRSTQRLDNILMELIDVTRISKASIKPETVDLYALIEGIIESMKHYELAKKIQFKIDIQTQVPVHSDQKLLSSIIQNLIVNSINYQDPKKEHAYITISAHNSYKHIIVQIEDNGLGIPKELHKKVFEMFFRGNTTSDGSGLGLYIVKNSVEKLKGEIQMQSEVGQGTVFSIKLPLTLFDTV